MSLECYNMTWPLNLRQIGRIYLALAIPAFIFHVLFWIQVATHPALRQMSMLWVYNYLITDILLLVQLFVEYSTRTMSGCVSPAIFNVLCAIEAYANSYMTVLEAYMLVCLNITRYYLIVKNFNIASRYPSILLIFNVCLYLFGIAILLIQTKLFGIVQLHEYQNNGSCHLDYEDIKTGFGNLFIVVFIPVILNCYFMIVTTIHVRQSQLAARSQRTKHLQLLVQFFVLYIFWLILWTPNVVASYVLSIFEPSIYARFGSIASALCDPLIFMFIDRRFLNVWRKTSSRILRCGRPQRQIGPTTSTRLTLKPLNIQSGRILWKSIKFAKYVFSEDTFDKLIFELILSKIWSSQSLFMWNIADDEGATVTGKVGRPSSFEVTINDKLVYSKLDSGHFPAFDKKLKMLHKVVTLKL
ncbi:unnamed protein product [Rotaria socialis]